MIAKVTFKQDGGIFCGWFTGQDGYETPKFQSQEFGLWFLKICVMRHTVEEDMATALAGQIQQSSLPEKITDSDRSAARILGERLATELAVLTAFPILVPVSPK